MSPRCDRQPPPPSAEDHSPTLSPSPSLPLTKEEIEHLFDVFDWNGLGALGSKSVMLFAQACGFNGTEDQ
eukprot:9522152-Alexandrium_andersonii.AAC.1